MSNIEFSCKLETVRLQDSALSLFKTEKEEKKEQNDEYMLKLEAWIEDDTAEKSQEAEFVVIVDRSGSMQGTPWKQVQQALIKMLELTKTDANIKVKSIAYNHGSSFLNLTGDMGVDAKTINGIRATGSTNFVAVFNELSQMFKDKKQDPSKPCFIFFMTDGEDTCNDEKQLMVGKEKLQTDIEHFGGSVVFHVLGFSESHNEEFLESLSFLGTSDGTYSFVSPKEGEKALEERIVSLIKSISSFVGRNINIEIVGENLEFQGENPEVTKSEIVLPAVMSKKDGKIQISTKKFVRVKDGSEPKFTLKLHDGKSKDEKTATLKNVETEVMEKKEDILDHNLVKMRTAMNQLITNTEEDNTNKEEVKKKYEEIEKSFKKLKIDESAPKATEKRMKAVQTGLNLLKDMYDPSYGMYSERERNLKKRAGYSEFQMLTAQQVNMSSKTTSEGYRAKNKYHVKSIQSSSRKMEMKTVYADRSDSESDDEDGYSQNFEVVDYPEVKKSASSKVKSLFKKSKK